MTTSVLDRLRALPEPRRRDILNALTPQQREALERDDLWWLTGRPEQQPPAGDWGVWLFLAGRGAGKTRTSAEWLVEQAATNPDSRWAIVAPTYGDARDTAVEGESGALSVLRRRGLLDPSHGWNRSLGELRLTNGSRIKLFSGEEPDRLRGPQHHGAWIDELAAFKYPREAWDQLQFGLRLGDRPRVVVSTTPRPMPLLRELLARDDGTVTVTRGSTFDNAANLAPAALAELRARYEGTRVGRQELYGELLEDVEGALFTRAVLDAHRVTEPLAHPVRRVVAIDPATTNTETSDWTGIVVASTDGHAAWIEHDYTIKGSVYEWSERAVWAYHEHDCDAVVTEVNNGGDMIPAMIRLADATVPVKEVRATRGKALRAEPVASLAEQGRLHIVGSLPDLEDQMTTWTPGMPSPDRLDAAVWAVWELLIRRPPMKPVQMYRT